MVRKVYTQYPDGTFAEYQTKHDYKFAVLVRREGDNYWLNNWYVGGHHKTEKAAQARVRWFGNDYYVVETRIVPVLEILPWDAVMRRTSRLPMMVHEINRLLTQDIEIARAEIKRLKG